VLNGTAKFQSAFLHPFLVLELFHKFIAKHNATAKFVNILLNIWQFCSQIGVSLFEFLNFKFIRSIQIMDFSLLQFKVK